jgi:hypothetical protein
MEPQFWQDRRSDRHRGGGSMTTRAQRKALIRLEQVEQLFNAETSREIWAAVFPCRVTAMPATFPVDLRLRVREYLRWASTPSRGEIGAAADVLYRQLWIAIAADDLKAAAAAAAVVPEAIRAELDRLTPGGIPTPLQILDPQHGRERAKELLADCIAGAEPGPGRRRPNGGRSRPRFKRLPRFKQNRGFPRQDGEMMLVRSLAEYYRSFNGGKFPRSGAHDRSRNPNPFERLVDQVLSLCRARGVNALKLVRRALDEIRDCELAANKGRSTGPSALTISVAPSGIIPRS